MCHSRQSREKRETPSVYLMNSMTRVVFVCTIYRLTISHHHLSFLVPLNNNNQINNKLQFKQFLAHCPSPGAFDFFLFYLFSSLQVSPNLILLIIRWKETGRKRRRNEGDWTKNVISVIGRVVGTFI